MRKREGERERERESGRERERGIEREIKREEERERERDVEYGCFVFIFKRNNGSAVAPFSYLVYLFRSRKF